MRFTVIDLHLGSRSSGTHSATEHYFNSAYFLIGDGKFFYHSWNIRNDKLQMGMFERFA